MKKKMIFFTIVLFIATLSLSAAPINIFGNVGMAFSDFEGLFFDVGAEMQLADNFWAQVLFDYYLNPSGEDLAEGVDDSAYGINLYGVYKFGGSDTMNFFAKAGVHYTTYEIGFFGLGISESKFGVAGGAGVEFKMGNNMALVFGGTYKTLFAEDTLGWFKIYGGINFKVGN